MICDSTFFVALDRESRKRREGPAHSFLRAHAAQEVAMSAITRGELARGFLRRIDWENFCTGFTVYPLTEEVLWKAAEVFQYLRKRGEPTGENDLWIAATALVAGQPLVTANAKDFKKIRGLQVLSHSEPS
jgi:tRNA(fMet)-specific endonuclease VapC